MQRCPKCGYRERFDWSTVLGITSFLGLWGTFGFAERYVPKAHFDRFVLIGLAMFLLFSVGMMLKGQRDRTNRIQAERLNNSQLQD